MLCATGLFATRGFRIDVSIIDFGRTEAQSPIAKWIGCEWYVSLRKLPVLGAKIGLCLADHEICLAGQYVER